MKRVLAFDIDQTLNEVEAPITDEVADLLIKCLDRFEICLISDQTLEQFLTQVIDPMLDREITTTQFTHLHLFVHQGKQYYRYLPSDKQLGPITVDRIGRELPYSRSHWKRIYNHLIQPSTPQETDDKTPNPAPNIGKDFGMTHLLEELRVKKTDVLYFGDKTQPGGNDYPIVQMGIDVVTVRNHEDTAYALRGILGVIGV